MNFRAVFLDFSKKISNVLVKCLSNKQIYTCQKAKKINAHYFGVNEH